MGTRERGMQVNFGLAYGWDMLRDFSLDLQGHTQEEAEALVRAGTHTLTNEGGMKLVLVARTPRPPT